MREIEFSDKLICPRVRTLLGYGNFTAKTRKVLVNWEELGIEPGFLWPTQGSING